MLYKKLSIRNKFTRIEVAFFLAYFFLFNILSDFEYNLYEQHNYILFVKDIPDRLVYGIVYLIPFAFCYKFLIKGLLLEKKYLRFLIFLAGFLVLLNFYLQYSYWLISKLTFLPAKITADANIYFHAKVPVHFSMAYALRELIVISCLAYFMKSLKLEKRMNAIRQEQLQAELKYLKVQLQPHFFFNTLNNIYALTLERSAAAAPLVAKHAEMMRYILYNSASPKVPLVEEIGFLQSYTEVETVRYGEKISISFDSQGIFNDGPDNRKIKVQAMIEPLLLLPFVENAFKHGIHHEIDAGYIRIIACLIENELILEVFNSKASGKIPRRDEEKKRVKAEGINSKVTGIGLKNVEKRLELLYPGKHRVEINETESVYELRLTLQLVING